jgi:hypothetical protein
LAKAGGELVSTFGPFLREERSPEGEVNSIVDSFEIVIASSDILFDKIAVYFRFRRSLNSGMSIRDMAQC